MRGHVQNKPFFYKLSKPTMTVKCVCSACNCGWMSDLENLARPVVGSLVQDISVRLDQHQQLTIAQWAMKTCMVMELIGRPRRNKFYTDEECQKLRLDSELPAPTFVWLGRYGGVNHIAAFGTDIWNDVPEKPGTIHGYVSTIVAGRLVVQVLSFHIPSQYGDRAIPINPKPGPWNMFLIPTWPFKRNFSWPLIGTIRDAGAVDLQSIARRWSMGGNPP
jgi:hypothetical protein